MLDRAEVSHGQRSLWRSDALSRKSSHTPVALERKPGSMRHLVIPIYALGRSHTSLRVWRSSSSSLAVSLVVAGFCAGGFAA